MVTGKKAKSTGPKSAAGKAKSSQNAVSHGLTSNRVMPDEIRMVEEFTQELTHYYKPESPLEVLQIQRIAFCRAKLAKLKDMEVAGREIARRQIELQPELIGGIRVVVGDEVLDTSVKARLEQMKVALTA